MLACLPIRPPITGSFLKVMDQAETKNVKCICFQSYTAVGDKWYQKFELRLRRQPACLFLDLPYFLDDGESSLEISCPITCTRTGTKCGPKEKKDSQKLLGN